MFRHANLNQRNRSRKGRNLRVELLEPRQLLAANLAAGEVFYENFDHPESFVLHSVTNPQSQVKAQYHIVGSGAFPEIRNGSAVPDGAGARVGSAVFESNVRRIDGPNAWYREEVIGAGLGGVLTPNTDYWYGFSMYFPQNFQPDHDWEIFSQWRPTSAAAPSGHPMFTFATKTDSGAAPSNHDILRISSSLRGQVAEVPISQLKGKWTDWVVHANWSTTSSGVIEVYRDGQMIGSKSGANIPANDHVPKHRLGIYKGSWKDKFLPNNSTPAPTEMTVYYDEWRIARSDNGTNMFSVVDPAQGDGGNTPPTAFDDTATTPVNTQVTTVDVLANDTDPNQGDALTVQAFTQSNNGSVVNNGDGTFTYTPNQNFNGVDKFDYTVSDGNGGSDVGTVNVTVGVVAVQSFEFESLVPETASSGDSVETKTDAAASGGEWVLYRSDEVGDFVTFTANVSQAGTYDIDLVSRLNAFRGQFQLSVDGTDVGGINDAYAATPAFGGVPLATGVNLTAGDHQFTFTVTGKNSASSDFQLSLDQLSLTALATSNGDFDADGDTDGADFLNWQRGFGSSNDANDLNDWQNNYGISSAVAGATAPEPATAEITGPVFLPSANLFSPVASRSTTDTVLDVAFAESGVSSNTKQQNLFLELVESNTSTTLAQEQAEEEEESVASFADSLDLAFQLP